MNNKPRLIAVALSVAFIALAAAPSTQATDSYVTDGSSCEGDATPRALTIDWPESDTEEYVYADTSICRDSFSVCSLDAKGRVESEAACLILSNPGELVQNCEYGAMACAVAGAHAQIEEVNNVPKDVYIHIEQAGGGNPNGLADGHFNYLTKIGGGGTYLFEAGQTRILTWTDMASVCKGAFARSHAVVMGIFHATAQSIDPDCDVG